MAVTSMNLRQSERVEMKREKSFAKAGLVGLSFLALFAVGCRSQVEDVPDPSREVFPAVEDVKVAAPAGLPNPPAKDEKSAFAQMVNNAEVKSRPDIFALQPIEVAYDTKARNDRIFQQVGGGAFFPDVFTPQVPVIKPEIVEPQPFRRLSGVLVGDSVMAIIDMGNGQPSQVIRPGMQIPNSPWKVISIDSDKAVLRRSGNIKPTEIIVHLQGPQAGGGDNGGGGFNPPPGFGNGGQPGVPQNPNQGRRGGRFGGGGGGGGGGGIS